MLCLNLTRSFFGSTVDMRGNFGCLTGHRYVLVEVVTAILGTVVLQASPARITRASRSGAASNLAAQWVFDCSKSDGVGKNPVQTPRTWSNYPKAPANSGNPPKFPGQGDA